MSQDYDKILKENIAALFLPLSEKYLGIRILSSRELPDLSRLRKLEGVTRNGIRKMAITYDISTDSLYQEGKQEGIEQVFQVKQLRDAGKTEQEISQVTKLPLATVKRIVSIL